jgi:hypothetical protein
MIKGKLVGLRAIEEADLELLQQWRNNPAFRRNFREVRELGMENQKRWFKMTYDNPMRDFMFGIVDIDNDQLIGACGLLYINWFIRSADFSFYIGRDNAYIDDKGYAEEAARLLIDYGFNNLNLHKIWMELYEFDKVKFNFFTQKFGFKQDALLRDNCFEDGKYWNSYIISLIND